MIIKKGAMFGLDARIALAIFGALSVISGASLYSAIQDSKLTATYTGMQEIFKALEALYLDTGSLRVVTDKSMYNTNDVFTDNSVAGWNGPYLSGKAVVDSENYMLENSNIPEGFTMRVRNVIDSNWNVADAWDSVIKCPNKTSACVVDLMLKKDSASDPLGKLLDDKYDDGIANTGKIRYGQLGNQNFYYIHILGFPHNAS